MQVFRVYTFLLYACLKMYAFDKTDNFISSPPHLYALQHNAVKTDEGNEVSKIAVFLLGSMSHAQELGEYTVCNDIYQSLLVDIIPLGEPAPSKDKGEVNYFNRVLGISYTWVNCAILPELSQSLLICLFAVIRDDMCGTYIW